jgi:hypothetical protein
MEINKETEIDLWELFAKGWVFFKRRIKIILSFLLIGLVYGISNFFTHPLDYRSFFRQEFIAQSSVTTDEILSDIINAIPVDVKNETNANFPEFRDIKGKLLANKNKETRLEVVIEVFDSTTVDTVLKAIGSRVSSVSSLKEKYDLTNKQLHQLLSEVSKQLAQPDSSKTRSNRIVLLEKKQSVEKQLTENNIVEFIPVNKQPVPFSNTREGVLNLLGYSFLGLILGAVIGWMLDLLNRKN